MAGPINPYDAPEPERRGMSGTTKVLLSFGIGCGLLLVLCCGVFGVGGMWMVNYFQGSISKDPVKVRELTQEIVSIEIPPALEPKGAIDMKLPWSSERLMAGVAYESSKEDSHLLLGQFGPQMAQMGDFEGQLRRSIRESDGKHDEDVEVLETETVDASINDEDAHFKVSKVQGKRSKKDFWDVIGQFRGKDGPAILVMRLATDEFPKDEALDIVHSLK